MMVPMIGCNKLIARDHLNKGVEAFKAGKIEAAINQFQQATQQDPQLAVAKNYLAAALSQNVVQGLTTPDNVKTAMDAIGIYKQVVAANPNDVVSLKGIAALYFSIKKMQEADDWQKKVLQVDPKDPEAAYTIGVIDWTQAHENALKIFSPEGITDDGKGFNPAATASNRAPSRSAFSRCRTPRPATAPGPSAW